MPSENIQMAAKVPGNRRKVLSILGRKPTFGNVMG
jgi:hypothetical protein